MQLFIESSNFRIKIISRTGKSGTYVAKQLLSIPGLFKIVVNALYKELIHHPRTTQLPTLG